MDEIKITLIVPVYDTPEMLLKKCLDSISINYDQKLEVIFIDDCSDEFTSREIVKFFEIHHLWTYYIRNSFNCGSSYGRNLGIKLSHGEWISFLDCDDYLEPDWTKHALESIGRLGQKEHIIQFNHYCVSGTGRHSGVTKEYEYVEKIPNMMEKLVFVWNKLFKTDLIKSNQITFPIGLTPGEDNYFSYLCYFYAGSMVHVDWYGINHVYRDGSVGAKLTKSTDCIRHLVIWNKLYEECIQRKISNDAISLVKKIMDSHEELFFKHYIK